MSGPKGAGPPSDSIANYACIRLGYGNDGTRTSSQKRGGRELMRVLPDPLPYVAADVIDKDGDPKIPCLDS